MNHLDFDTFLSTHIDDCVGIHQFCDGLNSLQADLQLVALTVDYGLERE